MRLFAERGYHAASMDGIAAEAGISKAVVYDHFTSKRELYTVLLDTIRGDMDTLIAEAIAPLPEGERVWTAIDVFFGYVERNRDACRLLFLEVQGTTEVAAIVQQLDERVAEALSATLAANPEIFGGHPERERQVRILAELLKSGDTRAGELVVPPPGGAARRPRGADGRADHPRDRRGESVSDGPRERSATRPARCRSAGSRRWRSRRRRRRSRSDSGRARGPHSDRKRPVRGGSACRRAVATLPASRPPPLRRGPSVGAS